MVYEKETVGINPSFSIEECDLVHAGGERCPMYVYGVLSCGVGRELPERFAYAIALYLYSQFFLVFGSTL